jgi:formate hydrogenlyase subunit 3/multisubunit Na+/H+ antiporter MnhD subunit
VSPEILLLQILVAPLLGVLVLALPHSSARAKEGVSVVAALANLGLVLATWGDRFSLAVPWAGFGMNLSLRLAPFSSFISVAAAAFGAAVVIYSLPFMRERRGLGMHYGLVLITLGMVNGAVLADNLVLMLFFWEGLLATTFGLIAIGHEGAFRTATKAFIIGGVGDLCMMMGVALTYIQAGTLEMSKIHLAPEGLAAVAFVFLLVGALAKGGAMPFHSWIPDAAVDAPLPFMALVPGSLEKLTGIYFLGRISLDLFKLTPESWLSTLMMIVGSVSLLFAVSMALVQKDYKKLLSFHAISQVGYMVLGIGTAVPVGIVGGLFHMINNALYKDCLFLTAGAVERQTGTTDLRQLGGLRRKMPVTSTVFVVAALSISGVYPFNGFFSKELVYDGALQRGFIFYAVAVLGSFFTAASFLKLGHAAFFGPRPAEHDRVREAPDTMLAPMVLIAAACIVFGIHNAYPVEELIKPVLPEAMLAEISERHLHLTGLVPGNLTLVLVSAVVLGGAVLNHWFGVKLNGSGLKAVDHIHHSPGLETLFAKAEQRWFDPYELFLKLVRVVAWAGTKVDRMNDWVFGFSARLGLLAGRGLRAVHTGNTSTYIVWALSGAALVVLYLVSSF